MDPVITVELDTHGPPSRSAWPASAWPRSHREQKVTTVERILIANAGINNRVALADWTPTDWDRLLAANLTACFFLAQHAAVSMRREEHGRIIFTTSIAGIRIEERTYRLLTQLAVQRCAKQGASRAASR